MTRESVAFGSQRALKAHLLRGTGGLSAEIADLRRDVEEGFQNAESKVGFPVLDALDPGTLLAAGQATFVIKGRNLLQGQTFDTLTSGSANAAVTVTALKPGVSGLSLAIVQGVGALAVALADGVLTVTLAAANSTATQVAAAINAEATCIGVVHAVAGGTGASNVVVAAETPLAGGAGYYAGNVVTINGQSCNPVQAASQWTDTSITVLVPALTGRIASDVVGVTVMSNGVQSNTLGTEITAAVPALDALDPGTLLAAGQASLVIKGRNLVGGQTFDTLTSGEDNAAVTVTMLKPGVSGVSLVIEQGVGALAAALADDVLTVTLAAANSTATEVAAAINAEATCIGIVHAVAGGTGADNVVVADETPLAGGAGYYAGNTVHINGQNCNPVQAATQWTDTSVTVLVPALTGRVATDIVGIILHSNGVRANSLSAVLT
jgi:hypothetical protein